MRSSRVIVNIGVIQLLCFSLLEAICNKPLLNRILFIQETTEIEEKAEQIYVTK